MFSFFFHSLSIAIEVPPPYFTSLCIWAITQQDRKNEHKQSLQAFPLMFLCSLTFCRMKHVVQGKKNIEATQQIIQLLLTDSASRPTR